MKLLLFVSFVLFGIAFIVNYPPAGTFGGLTAISWAIAGLMALVLALLIGSHLDALVAKHRTPPS